MKEIYALIASLTNFNALSAVHCIAMGLETPHIDDFNLRGEVALIRGESLKGNEQAIIDEVKSQQAAVYRARKVVNTGNYRINNVVVGNSVEIIQPTVEEVAFERKCA